MYFWLLLQPHRLKTGFVLQGHIIILYISNISNYLNDAY